MQGRPSNRHALIPGEETTPVAALGGQMEAHEAPWEPQPMPGAGSEAVAASSSSSSERERFAPDADFSTDDITRPSLVAANLPPGSERPARTDHGVRMSARSDRISEVLRALRASSPDVIGACLVGSEGFIVASVVPDEIDEELMGGVTVSLLSAGERMASALLHAHMEQVYVRSPRGYIIVNAVGSEARLVLLVTREAKLGLIFLELKRLTAELAKHVPVRGEP